MKTPIPYITTPLATGLLVLTLVGTLPFSGCKSRPAKSRQAEINKAASMTQLRDDLRTTRASLNRTTDSLNRIQAAPNALGEYNNYSNELTVLQKLSANSLINPDQVRETGTIFFNNWEQETQSIQFPEVREIADQRRTSVQSSFIALSTPLAAARTRLTEVTTLLTDLRKALSLDLTAAGISALRKQTEKATVQSTELANVLDSLATEVDKIANALPRPAPAASK